MNKLLEQILTDPSVRNSDDLETVAHNLVETEAPWNE
jgi:hypothetical protein